MGIAGWLRCDGVFRCLSATAIDHDYADRPVDNDDEDC